ncbi:MAG: tetratricopeptide repeat protein [Methylacidiphilales bacterium]|nr:tetratricopeptide repeat protein [Candidatus Methylacidiphilales bacterium]NJR18431.1 tetratricopeptide repeat protein [Calothrix sp. CSU_2_0]
MPESNKTNSEKIGEYKQVLKKFLRRDGIINEQGKTELQLLNQHFKLDNRCIALAYNSVGYEQLSSDNSDAAYMLFSTAIDLYEETPAAHAGRGDILYNQGKRKEAIKELERAKELFKQQKMSQEAIQIDKYLDFINKNDNIWNKVLITFGFRDLRRNKQHSSYSSKPIINNYYNNDLRYSNNGNFANLVSDNASQEINPK